MDDVINDQRREAFVKVEKYYNQLKQEVELNIGDKDSGKLLQDKIRLLSVELENFSTSLVEEAGLYNRFESLDFRNLSALVVDDEEEILTNIAYRLKKLGFTKIDTASNGRDAYNLCISKFQENLRFDFIISDWRMPTMDGLRLLQMVRNNVFLKTTPFMFITAVDDQDSIRQAIGHSVDLYLVKPYKDAEFDMKVRKLAESSKARHQ